MKNIIFVAPPAAGKGTASEKLVSKFNYKHISTGDLLREARKKDDDLGRKIATLMDEGALVTDDIVLVLLKNTLKDIKNEAFILDGFPRNINQANALEEIFNNLQISDYVVIYLNIDFEKALNRTLGRLLCPNCKRGYNKDSALLKPKKDGICDTCGSTLITRSDDTKETFEIRFNNYMKETNPVLKYYQEKNKLCTISTDNNIDEIMQNIERVI